MSKTEYSGLWQRWLPDRVKFSRVKRGTPHPGAVDQPLTTRMNKSAYRQTWALCKERSPRELQDMHRGWRATSLVMVGLTVLLTSVFNLCMADEKATETGSVEKTGKPLNTSEVATINLLADDIEKTWQHFCSKEGVPLKEVWQVVKVGQERHLVCKGDPKGFLFTKQEYANFELTFEWMSPSDPNGNSGVLIYTKKELRLWPTSMQVQLHCRKQVPCLPAETPPATSRLTQALSRNHPNGIRAVS